MENSDSSCDSNGSGIVEITDSNVDMVLASSELVFMFHATKGYQPRDSTRMMPIMFENAAKEISKAGLGPGKVVMATLDCKKYEALSTRFDMYVFYPSFKLFRNGYPSENGYRGKYTVEALVEFIKEQLTDPIIPFSDLNELHDLSEDKGHIIAYLDSKDQPEYDVLRKVATSLRESYRFYVKFGESVQEIHRPGQLSVVLRSLTGAPVELNGKYQGSLLSFGDILSWVKQKCFPLLREITSEHEDIRRNYYLGRFFILLHLPSDTQSLKKYEEVIRRELGSKTCEFTFHIANGIQFQQLLARFNKSTSDLPLIALDNYRRVNLFDFNVFEKPGKLNEIMDKVNSDDLYIYYEGNHISRLFDDNEEEYHIRGLFE
ncbi:endoplasmic reticulum resident protein 44-like [Maniola hyperantus]|uniref:endoplasmic reticulum resident protein 44-like n=1 Tax=Aphantopus hyperantus TaxID=2795564 RepID=UPI0015689373|nr:endoplasmic reticulum resident protein 44-like isoform X1 [Maniola hyperantus]XP_034840033.1 endoplasmic reticulum resident protein 44-like isoform X2 [Maniola hyperantus]